jgi:hypothetical protein
MLLVGSCKEFYVNSVSKIVCSIYNFSYMQLKCMFQF